MSTNTAKPYPFNEETGRILLTPQEKEKYADLYICMRTLLMVLILFGNILTILAVGLCKKLRTIKSNYLVLNLAVADLFIGLSLTYNAFLYLKGHSSHSYMTCVLKFCLLRFSITASKVNLFITAIDRYIHVVHPFQYEKYTQNWVIVATIAFGWIFSILTTIPLVVWDSSNQDASCQIRYLLFK